MILDDAASAREWLAAWGERAFTLGRIDYALEGLRKCLAIYESYPGRYTREAPKARAAIKVLEAAKREHAAGRAA